MKTLKIDENKAKELYPIASKEFKIVLETTFGVDFFKKRSPLDIDSLVKLVDYTLETYHINIYDLILDEVDTKNEDFRRANATIILKYLAKAYNEETVLNWRNTNEYKYFPYLHFVSGSCSVLFDGWCFCLHCPVGFYYKNEKLARQAYNNFKIYFEDFWGAKADQ